MFKKSKKSKKSKNKKKVILSIFTKFFEIINNKLKNISVPKLKNHKKELMRVFIILGVVIIIYFALIFIFQLRSVYNEQIIMETYPQYINIVGLQGKNENISIETNIKTNIFCRVSCDYSFKDLSTDEIIEEGSLNFLNYKKHFFNESLITNDLGRGQKIFIYEISCSTQESRMCSETNVPIVRNSFVSFNYEPSEEQQKKREEVLSLSQEITNLFVLGQTNILSSEARLKNATELKKNHLELEILRLNFFEELLKRDIERIGEDWKTQNYSFVYDQILNYNVFEKIISFSDDANSLINFISSEKEIHNEAISLINNVNENLPLLEDLRKANLLSINDEPYQSSPYLYYKTRELINLLNNKNFNEYRDLSNLLNEVENLNNNLSNFYDDNLINQSDLFVHVETWLQLINNDLCLISNLDNVNDCNNEINIVFDELNNISDVLNASVFLCNEINQVFELNQELFNNQIAKRENLSQREILLIDDEKRLVELSMIDWQFSRLGFDDVLIRDILQNYSSKFFNESLSGNISNNYLDDFDEEKRYYFLNAEYLDEDLRNFINICSLQGYSLPSLMVEEEEIEEVIVLSSNITILEENYASCCFNSLCKPCCDYDECKSELRNPLIVLHGYAYYSFNSAFHSVNAYDDFVTHSLNEGLYYPAGIIGPAFYPDYELNDLTRNFVPPVFKATYYDILRFEEIIPGEYNIKSQSISDYADRLNELVEFVKTVTGKTEIDLVAHSMGGLVVRSYIDKYGDESLGKIILVGTPNHGVPARSLYLCKFFGGQTECDEMYWHSSFMSYLNEEANIPKKEVHMLVGRGCSTFGNDGDGVVQVGSAELDFATHHYFNASCNMIDNFHRDMIKPSKHPEIYEKIVELLIS